jgi:hypothetical protein
MGLLFAGLTSTFDGLDPSVFDFAIRLQGGWAEVREHGAWIADTPYQPGDDFRITVASGVVTYSRNGVVFHTSAQAPTFPLLFGLSIATIDASISGITVAGGH